jgi:integrase/recombinase XerD
MFETLFKYPRVLARHREGPVADARERFLTYCAEQGLARESLPARRSRSHWPM